MASKLVIFALTLLIYKVQSQAVGCASSNPSCGCGSSQPRTFKFIPPNSNRGITASPQLQILPGQGSLKAIPVSKVLGSPQAPNNQLRCNIPKKNIQIPIPPQVQVPAPAQCPVVPPRNPTVITSPVSTITIPPTGCTTIIDNSLCNALANALQMLIANEFMNNAVCNNIINDNCVSLPVIETGIPGFDVSSLIRNLNSNQFQCQSGSTGCSQPCQSSTSCTSQTCQSGLTSCDSPTSCDWECLLERLREDQCSGQNPYITDSDWAIILEYINSQIDRSDCSCETSCDCDRSCESPCAIETEPANCNYDYSSLINYLKQRGQTGAQIAGQCQPVQSCDTVSNYNYQPYAPCDTDSAILEAIASYLGYYPPEVSCNCNNYPPGPNVAEVIFPEEIPAQLICNFGYLPSSVPVVSFSVQPVDPSCNFAVANQCQI